MSTFKTDIFGICNEVAAQFAGWTFVSGQFKNKTLKHTDLLIHPGFGFDRGTTPVQPSIAIDNKKAWALCKQLFGAGASTSIVSLQVVSHVLEATPEHLRLGYWVVQNKEEYLSAGQPSQVVKDRTLDITEAYSALVATIKDGISFIEKHYALGSEDSLLRALPAKYTTWHPNSPYDQMEKHKGVMMCIVHILLGDFDFVERYRSDEFKTLFPKRTVELDKIITALPELKKRYADTGSVI